MHIRVFSIRYRIDRMVYIILQKEKLEMSQFLQKSFMMHKKEQKQRSSYEVDAVQNQNK